MQIIFFFSPPFNSSHAIGVKQEVNLHIRSFKAFRFFWYLCHSIGTQFLRMTQREREREGSISMTPVYRTVQEGLSMVSCREGITKSKHVF